jgi:hypothetical protein
MGCRADDDDDECYTYSMQLSATCPFYLLVCDLNSVRYLLFKSSPHVQNVSCTLRSLKSITNYFGILLPVFFMVCWVKSVISDISVILSCVICSEKV